MAKERYHHGDLRGALLDAAETLVRERGVDGWSLREASARVGVSPSAAYHHFGSRDVLVHALSERVLARLGERLTAAVHAAPDQGPGRLVAYGCGYVGWAVDDPAVARLVFRGGATGPQSAVHPHPHDVLAAELDRLADTGRLPGSARPGAEFVVWSAIHGLAVLLIDGLVRIDSREDIDRQTERHVRATLDGLRQEAAPPDHWPTAYTAHTQRRPSRPPGTSAESRRNVQAVSFGSPSGPEEDTCDVESGQVDGRGLLVAGGDTSPLLEAVVRLIGIVGWRFGQSRQGLSETSGLYAAPGVLRAGGS
jgi:AcrR family transcriptional regulator